MRPGWKWMAAMSVLVLGIVVSVSGAATSGSKRDGGGTSTQSEKRQGEKRLHVIGAPGEHLSTLADELGVTEAKLRDALEAVREDLKPPQRPRRGQRPTQAQMEKKCNELTDALAKELGKSGDDVRAAVKAAAKKDIEKAVDADRLTRSEADQILSKLDKATCLPAFGGFHKFGGPGCGGPGGPDGPGERGERHRFEHPAPPSGSGSEGSSTVAPAPLGAPA